MLEALEEFLGKPDHRLADYPMMDSPDLTVVIVFFYLAYVKFAGPFLMKNKKPYDLRLAMIIYNIAMVFLSAWLFLSFGIHGWFGKYNLRCPPIDRYNGEDGLKMSHVSWVFYISKIIELTDTVFFVLRKKYSNINFLHVFHHASVPITCWYTSNYGPDGYYTIFPLANSFVHIWMYLYYGLSAMGPGMQKYLWWKKYLTTLQLIQFKIVIVYFVQLMFFAPVTCGVSKFLVTMALSQAFLYLYLFTSFYKRAYTRSQIEENSSGKYLEQADVHNDNSKRE